MPNRFSVRYWPLAASLVVGILRAAQFLLDVTVLADTSFGWGLLETRSGGLTMRKRHKLSRRSSRKSFTRNAIRVNSRNMGSGFAMRGGIRM